MNDNNKRTVKSNEQTKKGRRNKVMALDAANNAINRFRSRAYFLRSTYIHFVYIPLDSKSVLI